MSARDELLDLFLHGGPGSQPEFEQAMDACAHELAEKIREEARQYGEEALIQTFKDVIAFVEGEQAPQASGALRAPAGPGEYTVSVEPATGNGWAAVYGPPALPARLQGEVELVQPGEGA